MNRNRNRNRKKKKKKKKRHYYEFEKNNGLTFSLLFQVFVFVVLFYFIYDKFLKSIPGDENENEIVKKKNDGKKYSESDLQTIIAKLRETEKAERKESILVEQKEDLIPFIHISNYDPKDLTIRRGVLPRVRNLRENELKDMKIVKDKVDGIFDVMINFRKIAPPNEKPIVIAHHNLEGYPGDALNVVMFFPTNGGDPIKLINMELVGFRDGVTSTQMVGSARFGDKKKMVEIETHETIHVKYIDPDLKQIPVQRGKSEFVETRKTHMKLSGSEASSMEITSREMDENEEDPFGITNY